jgi:hypothetical protein
LQLLAIRSWQLAHGGQFPKSLDLLVPEILPNLPTDPYSGRPFHYIVSTVPEIPPIFSSIDGIPGKAQPPLAGSWLLYSVGPNGRNDHGSSFNPSGAVLDIVFAVTPLEGDEGGAAKKGHDKAKN